MLFDSIRQWRSLDDTAFCLDPRKLPSTFKLVKSSAKNLAVLMVAILAANLQAAQVTTVIDDWTGSQSLAAENTSVTNTISSPGVLGGFRTASLTSLGNEPDEPTRLVVSTNSNRFNLTTPEGPTPTFMLTWGGAGGSAGLGGFDFGGGQSIDLFTSVLSFSLRSADLPSDFTWEFTDAGNNKATYTGNFPTHLSSAPPLGFTIALNSFSNSPSVNWNAIDFIVFSGGNVSGLDMSMPASIELIATVPEPGTWTLLAVGALVTACAIGRRARQRS